MTPEISVLIPLYNCEEYIGAAIESVRKQTFHDYEILVVDDGSTDEGWKTASSCEGVRLIRREHAGIAKTRNFALSEAKGKLIAFLDADDLYAPEKLKLQKDYLDSHPQCDIVFCRYQCFTDIQREELTPRQKQTLSGEIPQYMAGACIRKELFGRYGVFREDYTYGEDTEWLARLEIAQVDLSHKLDSFLYFRRIHNSNISLTHRDMSEKERYSILADAIREKWRKTK